VPNPAGSGHSNDFNLLRLGLASAVLFSHCFELVDRSRVNEPLNRLTHAFTAGDLAVDAFFLLSGFLVLQSWNSDPHSVRYLQRRALRIYPAFVVATLVCGLVLGPLFGGADYFSRFQPAKFAAAALALREPRVPPVFVGLPYTDVNGSMWTIQYEFMCYVVVVAGGLALRNSRWFWWASWIGAVALETIAGDAFNRVRFPGWRLLLGDEPAEFVRFLGFFSAGALWFHYRDRLPRHRVAIAVAAVAAIASMFHPVAARLLLPTAGAYLLFAFAYRSAPDTALRRFVRRNDLSYGLYLFAWPVQQVCIRLFHPGSAWALLPIALPSALCVAGLSWLWIERPALRWKPASRR
jgi:peptidoglycan/LPS O-acetylase OafA/YrhL